MRITPAGMSINQTVVTLTANTDAKIVSANANRRYLAICNIGTNVAALAFDVAAVAAQGWPLAAAPVAGEQGGTLIFEASGVPLQAVHAISTAGTTLIVMEGI